jgi:hypothetical protein
MRQIRHTATGGAGLPAPETVPRTPGNGIVRGPRRHPARLQRSEGLSGHAATGRDLQRQAWQWAQANRASDGSLPSGKEIGRQYGRHERWGRLVKRSGSAGGFVTGGEPGLRLVEQ